MYNFQMYPPVTEGIQQFTIINQIVMSKDGQISDPLHHEKEGNIVNISCR